MNYGGTGPYGQPPMGGGMGPSPNQMNMAGQPQHQMMMNMQQQQQQGNNMQQQQRMMMQNGVRQMYQPGMMPQQGMMPPQPMHMGMYQQQGMQQPHSATNVMHMKPQMSRAAQQEMFARFPEEWKAEIQKTKNPEHRNQLIQFYMTRFQAVARQQAQQQQIAHPQGTAMNPEGHAGPSAIRGGAMFAGPMQQPGPSPTPGLRMNQSAGMGMTGPMSSGPNSGMNPPSHTLAPSPQVMPSGSPASLSVNAINTGASPLVGAQIQPATPKDCGQHPNSVGEPQQPSSVQQAISQEYAILRKSTKDKYYDQLKRIVERCSLDNVARPSGLDVVMEILDNKRIVDMELFERAVPNLKTIVERQSLGWPLMAELRRHHQYQDKVEDAVKHSESIYPDPWKSLRHLFVKVPDEVLERCHSFDNSRCKKNELRRNRAGSDNDDEPPIKLIKLDNGLDHRSAANLKSSSSASSRGNVIEEELNGDDERTNRIEIECTYGSSQKWRMSVAASAELNELPWRVESDCLPDHWKCPDVVICLDSKMMMLPPLRVLVPATYPSDAPVVQYDRSFPSGAPYSGSLATMFERSLSLSASRSLTCIYEAFKSACQELMRLKGGVHTGHYVPNNHQQKQLVA